MMQIAKPLPSSGLYSSWKNESPRGEWADIVWFLFSGLGSVLSILPSDHIKNSRENTENKSLEMLRSKKKKKNCGMK